MQPENCRRDKRTHILPRRPSPYHDKQKQLPKNNRTRNHSFTPQPHTHSKSQLSSIQHVVSHRTTGEDERHCCCRRRLGKRKPAAAAAVTAIFRGESSVIQSLVALLFGGRLVFPFLVVRGTRSGSCFAIHRRPWETVNGRIIPLSSSCPIACQSVSVHPLKWSFILMSNRVRIGELSQMSSSSSSSVVAEASRAEVDSEGMKKNCESSGECRLRG